MKQNQTREIIIQKTKNRPSYKKRKIIVGIDRLITNAIIFDNRTKWKNKAKQTKKKKRKPICYISTRVNQKKEKEPLKVIIT